MNKENISRCSWANPNNPLYLEYHDNQWGVPTYDDHKLFEMLILENFQAGLSWECVLNKRAEFIKAFDNFNINKIIKYDDNKIKSLLSNEKIIRNRLKINATISNAKCFLEVQKEYGSFSKYIWSWTNNNVIIGNGEVVQTSPLSDCIAKDLKKRGFKFCGSTIIYSYLQAVGIINDHQKNCYKCVRKF